MRSIKYLLVFFFINTSWLCAQNYTPILSSDTVNWTFTSNYLAVRLAANNMGCYYVSDGGDVVVFNDDDTLIGGLQYKKVYEGYFYLSNPSLNYIGAMR